MKNIISFIVLAILFMAQGCTNLIAMEKKTFAIRSESELVKFEKESKMSREEAYRLVLKEIKKGGQGAPHIINKPVLLNGKFFFPREVDKFDKVRERGYYVDPKNNKVQWVDTPKRYTFK